jgi:uncharacterized membrane-anchored protein YitT (DUF2179 family)
MPSRNLSALRQISLSERYGFISAGIFLMVCGFYFFLVPADLVIGGVSGLGLVINRFVTIPIGLIVFITNIFLLILAYLFLGKKAFIRSVYGSLLYPLFLILFETFLTPLPIEDLFIASVFGGLLTGIGFGIVVRYGGTSGGSDIPIRLANKYLKLPLSLGVYLVDGLIIIIGAFTLGRADTALYALYALIAIFVVGRAADRMVIGSNTLKTVHIITSLPTLIKDEIFKRLDRGVTIVPIEGGYTQEKKTMLITVITRNEYYTLRDIVADKDAAAFVYASPATEIHGDFGKREDD